MHKPRYLCTSSTSVFQLVVVVHMWRRHMAAGCHAGRYCHVWQRQLQPDTGHVECFSNHELRWWAWPPCLHYPIEAREAVSGPMREKRDQRRETKEKRTKNTLLTLRHQLHQLEKGTAARPDRSSTPCCCCCCLPVPPAREYAPRSLCSSMYGFRQPMGRRHTAHLGRGFLHCGQQERTGFCLDSHEFAMPSCLRSLDRGREALQ